MNQLRKHHAVCEGVALQGTIEAILLARNEGRSLRLAEPKVKTGVCAAVAGISAPRSVRRTLKKPCEDEHWCANWMRITGVAKQLRAKKSSPPPEAHE